jgi:hypothetical protein
VQKAQLQMEKERKKFERKRQGKCRRETVRVMTTEL